jgi:hypothetical protein
MKQNTIRASFGATVGLALALLASGCSVGATGFATDLNGYHEATLSASTSEPLVRQDGRCESDVSIDPSVFNQANAAATPQLGSTECQLVARLGSPYSVEIRRGPHGERLARLTYVSGARLGIYNFTNNRLSSIEH